MSTTIARRVAAGFALTAAPAVIFLGAVAAHADAARVNTGPSVTHEVFPQQHDCPQAGTTAHHHQNHHAK